MREAAEAHRRTNRSKSTLFIFTGRRCEDGCIPYKTFLRPAGPLRLAGRFLLFSEDKPASKKFFKKLSKRRLLAGSERLCVRLVSGKGENHLIPPGKGVKRWM